MQKFSKWLLKEAISATAVDSVNKIVKSYLEKKLGTKVYCFPGVEQYINSTGRGYGVRYFYKNKSIRFNWKGANITSFTLDSVDLWDGTSHDPNWHMEFDGQQSLVKTLPIIIDFIESDYGTGEFYFIPEPSKSDEKISESLLIESKDIFDYTLSVLKPNEVIPLSNLGTPEISGSKSYMLLKKIMSVHPQLFSKQGRSYIFKGTQADLNKLKDKKDDFISLAGGTKVKVTKGGSKETYAPTEQEVEIESKGIEKVAYEEQLKHLAILLKLVVKGTSNALFVAGRGGTGKTQTIETELAKAGLQDGDGYYKNTGSASPIGIYMSLYNNRNSIILFDDCDSALNDQEGRNLIKAATDTKKFRKVAWNKKSSIIVPRDQYEEAEESSDEPPTDKNGNPLYPNSFEFSGRVIFISNLSLDKLDPDGALRTRGFIIDINPTNAELIDYMTKIAPKIRLENGSTLKQAEIDEVVNVIKNSKSKNDVSLRKLVRGLNVKSEMKSDPLCDTIIKLYA